MRIARLVVATAAGSIGLLVVTASHAQRPAAPPANGTAVVNLNTITKNSKRFKQQLDAVRANMEAAKADLQKESDRGNDMAAKVQKLPPNSPERKTQETQLVKARADFELRGKRMNDMIQDQETKLMFNLIREITGELEQYAQANRVPIILRNDAYEAELTDPRAILQEINKSIVYQRDSDITPAILDSFDRRPAATAKAPAQGKQR